MTDITVFPVYILCKNISRACLAMGHTDRRHKTRKEFYPGFRKAGTAIPRLVQLSTTVIVPSPPPRMTPEKFDVDVEGV